jgi:DNA modification methylase
MIDPYLDDGDVRLYKGDSRETLLDLPAGIAQTCVTSPPYYGLRDYGTAEWIGGDPSHDHAGTIHVQAPPGTAKQASNAGANGVTAGDCSCGARRVDRQIGLEQTPDEYVEQIVDVMRGVWHVLRDDGTAWVNLGDSYAGSWGAQGRNDQEPSGQWGRTIRAHPKPASNTGTIRSGTGLKAKDLMMIPAMVALALRADGWTLRAEIIWHKPNPMPESVDDRPTKADERVLLLAKRNDPVYWTHRELAGVRARPEPDYRWIAPDGSESIEPMPKPWRRVNLWEGNDYFYDAHAIREKGAGRLDLGNMNDRDTWGRMPSDRGPWTATTRVDDDRNARSVWTITPRPYICAHVATFPPELVARCVRAGTSEHGQCVACGAPVTRVVELVGGQTAGRTTAQADAAGERGILHARYPANGSVDSVRAGHVTRDWRPSCRCDAGVEPQIVVDPFIGSGTTAVVARQMGRHTIGVDLSAEYLDMAADRLAQRSLLT